MLGKMMKRLAPAILAASFLAGCITSSPYDHVENWLIREDPVRTFVVPSDLFYVQSSLYSNVAHIPLMYSYAQAEVGKGRFSGIARVFSPLVANSDDLEKALDWYFKYHHTKGRPFSFVGEGEGGALLQAYEKKYEQKLKRMGLVASFYTDKARKGFVTQDTVRQIKEAVAKARYRTVWGRDAPEGMLKAQPAERP